MVAKKPSVAKLDRTAARAVLLTAQGLAPDRAEVGAAGAGGGPAATPPPPDHVVREHGFVRTLGGAEAYVAVHARRGGLDRTEMDGAVAERRLQVVPAARGCIYLVDRQEVPWALRLAETLSASRSAREAEKAGILPGELDELGDAVVEALREQGPLDPNALRKALPDDAVRSLGEAGKKLGLSSTLPPALRQLEFAGRVERQLAEGRLDSERYLWRTAEENPFDGTEIAQAEELHRHFAERFFHWIGLATADDFAAWAGLGKRDARAAVAALENAGALVPVEVAEGVGEHHATPEALAAASPDGLQGTGHLLPFEDNLLHLPGDPTLLTDPEHRGLEVPAWGRRGRVPLGETKHLGFRGVVADGRLAGFWDFDPDAGEVAVGFFAFPSDAARRRVEAEAAGLSRLLASDLGHGKSFSLDSDDALRRRVAEIRRYRE